MVNGNTSPGKKENTVKEGFILQHVHGPGLSGSGDYGIDGRYEGRSVIRVLLDEALGARRRKALGIGDSEEPSGQGTAETLHTIQTLLLKLIKRGELVFRRQTVDFKLMQEAVIEARAGREVAFEELVARALMEKGHTRESNEQLFRYEDGHRSGIC